MKMNELFETMRAMVNDHVNYYKTDIDIDISIIKRDSNNDIYNSYIWMLRDSGTHIVSLAAALYDPIHYYNAVTSCTEIIKTYRINNHANIDFTIKDITNNIDPAYIQQVNICDINIFDNDGVKLSSLNNCAFTRKKDADKMILQYIAETTTAKKGYYTVSPARTELYNGYIENFSI